MIEHRPWKGNDYGKSDIGKKRLAIVGHSHFYEDGKTDHHDFTCDTVCDVIRGKRLAFFTRISGWFGLEPTVLFQGVVFFNFVPCAVGNSANRFRQAPPEEYIRGEERFLRIIANTGVEKVIVCSNTLEKKLPEPIKGPNTYRQLLSPPRYWWHEYDVSGKRIPTFQLPHPIASGATEVMAQTIREILDHPTGSHQ